MEVVCPFNKSSMQFPFQGNLVAVGTHKGYVQIWDVAATKKINTLEGHSARVGKNNR